jgi:hypothetical protein
MSLKPRERWEGIIVGGGASFGLLLIAYGLYIQVPWVAILGACLFAPAIPASLALSVNRPDGRKLYGTLAWIVGGSAGCGILSLCLPWSLQLPLLAVAGITAAVGVMAASVLATFGAKQD